MASLDWPSTQEISDVFEQEIVDAGGSISDRFDDGKRLYLRSVLPGERAVGHRDMVQGGVALRATEAEIWVHPYVFRQVCKNGAIIAHATQTVHIESNPFPDGTEAEPIETLREAIHACCAEEALAASAQEMSAARAQEIDMKLVMGAMLSRLPVSAAPEILQAIMQQLFESRDNSAFGVLNAITSVARDTRDPELRWRLEEFGGGIPALIRDPRPQGDRSRGLVSSGV